VAIPLLERALAIAAKKTVDASTAAEVELDLAKVLWDRGDKKRAVTLVTEARAAWAEVGAAAKEPLAECDAWLAAHKI